MCTKCRRCRRNVGMRRLVVLVSAVGLVLFPFSAMGQERAQEAEVNWASGLLIGVVGGTAVSTLSAALLCGVAGLDAGRCGVDGVQYGTLPALASGLGLSYPDRTTGKGRLRTVALGAAGGFLTVLGVWTAVRLDPSLYIASPNRAQFLRATFWGAGIGFMTAAAAPYIPVAPSPSPAPLEAPNASPVALGLAFRVPLP